MGIFEPPQGWGPALVEYLGIEPWRIPVVMLSAVGIYLTFLVLVRIFGVRVLSGWNGFDAVIIIMFGAVAGRVIIGHPHPKDTHQHQKGQVNAQGREHHNRNTPGLDPQILN